MPRSLETGHRLDARIRPSLCPASCLAVIWVMV